MSRYTTLSSCLVDKFTISAADADAFVVAFFDTIKEYVEKDKIVKVKGLGTFKLVEVSAREMIDINTHERITLSSKQRITFTPEGSVRDRVNSPFSQFESIELEGDADFSEIDSRYGVGEVAAEEEKAASEEEPTAQQEEPQEESDVSYVPADDGADNNVSEEDDGDDGNDGNDEDEDDDEEYEEPRRSRAPYVIIILVALVLIAAVGYFAYQAGMQRGFMAALPAEEEVVEETIIEALPADTIAEKDSAAVVAQEVEAAENEKNEENDSLAEVDYNNDPRLRLGAYEIVGLDTIVRVLPGQTLKGISRAHFGDEMECYVVVYNGGITSVEVGDEVRIPKLRVKASVRGRMRH